MNENWKDIGGYDGSYQVSDQGRIRSLDRVIFDKNGLRKTIRGRIIKCCKNNSGYYQVGLCLENHVSHFLVHRLVALTFVENIHVGIFDQVNHINGDKEDNRAINLEWCSNKLNSHHSEMMGLKPIGHDHPNAKLTSEDIIAIINLYETRTFTCADIATQFNVSETCVCNILNGKSYVSTTGGINRISYVKRGADRKKITKSDVVEIREKHKSKKYTIKELANQYKMSAAGIESVIYRRTWKYI